MKQSSKEEKNEWMKFSKKEKKSDVIWTKNWSINEDSKGSKRKCENEMVGIGCDIWNICWMAYNEW